MTILRPMNPVVNALPVKTAAAFPPTSQPRSQACFPPRNATSARTPTSNMAWERSPAKTSPAAGMPSGTARTLGHDSCGHVRLIELDITWTLVAGQLVTTVGLSIELDSGSSYWEQEIIGPIDCYGGFTFTFNDLVSNESDCDYAEATIELSGRDEDPCFPPSLVWLP